MSENHLVPNSFQHPNFLIDKLDYYLTAEESKVLSKAVREILGWRDKITERKAPISLSVFVDGKFNKDGKRLCRGCGLGLQTVRNTLASLHKFGILLKVDQPTQDGQMYWLQDDESKIDWEALETRRAQWDEVNAKRTKKATKESLVSRGVTSDVRGNVGRKEGVTSDVNKGVTSDVNKETQGGAAEKTPPEAPSHTQNQEQNPFDELPVAIDGHQRAVDQASGGTAIDPVERVAEHLRWLCVGPGVSLPTAPGGRKPYLKAARALLEKTNAGDWRGVCFAVDDWSEHPPKEDEWRRERTKEPGFSLDHITAHYWTLKDRAAPAGPALQPVKPAFMED